MKETKNLLRCGWGGVGDGVIAIDNGSGDENVRSILLMRFSSSISFASFASSASGSFDWCWVEEAKELLALGDDCGQEISDKLIGFPWSFEHDDVVISSA